MCAGGTSSFQQASAIGSLLWSAQRVAKHIERMRASPVKQALRLVVAPLIQMTVAESVEHIHFHLKGYVPRGCSSSS